MFKNKNDYSVIIFLNNQKVIKMPFVGNLYSLRMWLQKNNIDWHHMNVYNRRQGYFMKQYKPDEFIPAKPRF